MDALEKLIAAECAANRKAEAKSKAPTKKEIETEANFLRGWSKGKPIRRIGADGTFWSCGKWMTKITFKMADALVASGYATLEGSAKEGGAILTIKK